MSIAVIGQGFVGETHTTLANTQKALDILGWKAKINLDDYIHKTCHNL